MDSSGLEFIMSRFTFRPLHVHSEWLEAMAGFAKRLTVAVVLPSGVGSSDAMASIEDDAKVLKVDIRWSIQLEYLERLFSSFVKNKSMQGYTEQHPEIVALEEKLKKIRNELQKKRNETLCSTGQICLPFR